MKENLVAFGIACVLAATPFDAAFSQGDPSNYNYRPPGGYVATKQMAISIGIIILEHTYGEKLIRSEYPFHAVLNKDGIWIITGSLDARYKGGVGEIWISKSDGRVVRMLHSE